MPTSFNAGLMAQCAKDKFQNVPLPAGSSRSSFNNFIDAISGAVSQTMDAWRVQATLDDVVIHAALATGGKMRGPGLEGLVRGYGPAGSWDVYTRAVAAGLHNQMRSFENDVKVPGLPWYPMFAAFPLAVAPPVPNVPCPLLVIGAQGLRWLEESALKGAIIAKYPNTRPACADELAKAVANGFAKAVVPWMGCVMVKLVMGSGRVPSYAPPFLVVGPVVDGRGKMLPGGLC